MKTTGWLPIDDLGLITVTGDDRQSWLQGMMTQDVSNIEKGQARYTTILNIKGRVVSDGHVYSHGDQLLMTVPRERVQTVIAHLEARLITEDAELIDATADYQWATLQGPDASRLLGTESGVAQLVLAGQDVLALRHRRTGQAGYDLLYPADSTPNAIGTAWTMQDLETRRLEGGIPRFGADFGEDMIALEACLVDAIHWKKGCYLGQEVVTRMAHRGHTNKELRLCSVTGTVAPGAEVWALDEKKAQGVVKSVSADRAIALLRRAIFEPGTKLRAGDAELVVLPTRIREHAYPLPPEYTP